MVDINMIPGNSSSHWNRKVVDCVGGTRGVLDLTCGWSPPPYLPEIGTTKGVKSPGLQTGSRG